jgi:hypothetical protein
VDIGSGLPTMDNTHEVTHGVDADIKVAYVDRDPQAVTHARALLEEGDKETVFVLDGDLREPVVLTHLLGDFIDFSQPVCIMLVAVMYFTETPECYRLVDEYKDRMAPGSYLIMSHSTADFLSAAEADTIAEEYDGSNAGIFLRGKQEVSRPLIHEVPVVLSQHRQLTRLPLHCGMPHVRGIDRTDEIDSHVLLQHLPAVCRLIPNRSPSSYTVAPAW